MSARMASLQEHFPFAFCCMNIFISATAGVTDYSSRIGISGKLLIRILLLCKFMFRKFEQCSAFEQYSDSSGFLEFIALFNFFRLDKKGRILASLDQTSRDVSS